MESPNFNQKADDEQQLAIRRIQRVSLHLSPSVPHVDDNQLQMLTCGRTKLNISTCVLPPVGSVVDTSVPVGIKMGFKYRNAVVTGANKGIGLEICRQLASNGIMVILTARNEKRGIEAVENLKGSGLSNVVFHQLDVMVPASINSLANFIKTHFGKLDILVNNAGVGGVNVDVEAFRAQNLEVKDIEVILIMEGISEQTYELAEECLKTNYYGTKGVTEALLPLLQLSNSARIVNLSSVFGQLECIHNEKVKAQLNDVDCLTEEKLDELLQSFLKDFKEDMLQVNGWPIIASAYKVSKAAINAYTRILARKFPNFLINCVHPGEVKTDLNLNMGDLTPEEGARAPVMVALLPENGPSGLYFDQMNISTF